MNARYQMSPTRSSGIVDRESRRRSRGVGGLRVFLDSKKATTKGILSSSRFSLMSKPQLATICAEEGLPVFESDTAATIRRRLADHLIGKRLVQPPSPAAVATFAPRDVLTGQKRSTEGEQPKPKRAPTAYHAFLRQEMDRVKAAGFRGRVECIKEVARRWKLAKAVNSEGAPLMLMHSSQAGSSTDLSSDTESASEEDALIEALRSELDEAQLNASLSAYGLPIDGSTDDKIKALARAMTA